MLAFLAVYKRELGALFRANIAYAIAFAILLFLGVVFSSSVAQFVTFNQSDLATVGIPARDAVQGVLGTLAFLMFIIAPLLTMRLLSEEQREGTLETLMTLPMPEASFVLGKFIAVWTFYTVLLALTLLYVGMLDSIGVVAGELVIVAYLGAWLYGGSCLALSLVFSALTEDQIVAAFSASAFLLVLFLADGVALIAANNNTFAPLADFVRELGLQAHYQQTMLQGVLRAEDIVYFVALITLALFVTTLIVGSRRWR
jgi:ABC-2 type transport system permease protein